jgi:DnaK suppressor protein
MAGDKGMPAKKKVAKKTAKKTGSKATAKKKATPAAKKTASKKKPAAKKSVAKKPAVKKKAAASKKKPAAKKAATPVKKPRSASKKPLHAEADIDVHPLYGEPYKFKKGEEYMNENQVQHFRNILNAWKTDLMEEVDRTVHHMQDEAANFPDPNDRASQETEFSLELRTRDRERKLIKKIDEALGKLKDDEYGYCEVCGIEIGVRRLEARPTAAQCIDCKTLDEIREKQMG